MEELKKHIRDFYPFAKKRMGFNKPPTISLKQDEDNAKNVLGKTAYYDPESFSITLFVTGRHPKDILRSLAHELVHHTQNCEGEFDNVGEMGEGYAQTNPHLRDMEVKANRDGSMCLRDWEDSIKHRGEQTMAMNENKLRKAIRVALKKVISEGGGYTAKTDADGLPVMVPKEKKKEKKKEEKKEAVGEGYEAPITVSKRDKDKDEPVEEGKVEEEKEEVDVELEEGGRANRPENANQGEERRMTTSSAMREGKVKRVPIKEWYENNLYNKLIEQFARK